jgi:16S rRNA (cytidine1402-2'-O)-methyltransferase
MAKLYIIATPIGNLEDITFRAVRILKEVDLVLAENVSKAKNLLKRYEIEKQIIKYDQHSLFRISGKIVGLIEQDNDIALISEAGTPGISDPGNELIEVLYNKFGDSLSIIPIPGPSSVSTAASLAGISMQKFSFLGFVPKKKQNKFFKELIESNFPVIFFETPYRIIKTLEKIQELAPDAYLVVMRELTKKFETVYRGKAKEIIEKLLKTSTKGEFVIVFKKDNER